MLATLASMTAIGTEAAGSVGEVAELFEHSTTAVRAAAVACLAKIEPDKSKSVPLLTDALHDEDWTVRRDAAVLGDMGSVAKEAVPVLFKMLASEEDVDAARGALRGIDDAGPNAVPVLMEGLESEDRRLRFYAMFLIGKVGPDAKEACRPSNEYSKKPIALASGVQSSGRLIKSRGTSSRSRIGSHDRPAVALVGSHVLCYNR